ncbi:MAG: TetR/AcrR family transcriptional regulator [Parasporobacterium sp.]|nr:TetR/AcrR family transcriptional regulator [Parasporobacterium sp.]
MGNIDLRVVKTLENIDNALLENLKTKPLNKITVEALCKDARINRTTFYKHYTDKYELLDNFLSRQLEEFKENNCIVFVDADPENVNDDRFKLPFRETVDFLISKKDIYEVLWTAHTDRNVFNEMVEAISESILKRFTENRPDVRDDERKFFLTSLYANLFAYNFLVSIRWWFANDYIISKRDFNKMFDDMMKVGLFRTFKEQI